MYCVQSVLVGSAYRATAREEQKLFASKTGGGAVGGVVVTTELVEVEDDELIVVLADVSETLVVIRAEVVLG